MIRVGFGYDVHKFSQKLEDNSSIFLCGIEIPYKASVISNSDGDVAMHALVDAMLGAIAENDIGHYFPPDEKKWQSYNSSYFLKFADQKLKKENYQINNIDIVIICEKPKILPYKNDMRSNIANILEIDISQVSVKGKTTEKLGFTGREEGIAAHTVVLISK